MAKRKTVTKKKPTMALYIKPGEFLRGVPARDMTMDEWEALDPDVRELALKLGLYAVGEPEPVGGLDEWPDIIAEEKEEVKETIDNG